VISNTAGKAMQIRAGLQACKFADAETKWSIIDRIIYDLDEAGNRAGVATVREILWELWQKLPDRHPEMAGFLDEHVAEAGPPPLPGDEDREGS
jgi:hypothetical protein